MELNGFDARVVEPNAAFDPLPADWYMVVITASEEKPTKAQTGSLLELKLEVIEGEYKGRLLFDRLNLNNPNKQAVDIAQATLSAICRAVNVMTPKESSELHDRPMMAKVVVKPAEGGYSASNNIKGYAAVEGKASAPAAQPPKAAASAPPWKR